MPRSFCGRVSPIQGLQGRHSSVLYDVVRVLGQLQHLAGHNKFAYMIKCVAAQHNFNSHEVRSVMHPPMCSMIGVPITVDAARLGSRAHRLKNYRTNMASYADAQLVLDAVERDPNRLVQDILDPGRTERDAADDIPPGHYRSELRRLYGRGATSSLVQAVYQGVPQCTGQRPNNKTGLGATPGEGEDAQPNQATSLTTPVQFVPARNTVLAFHAHRRAHRTSRRPQYRPE
ncbi:hypothetical protein CYMTET_38471 [Cymbomonas tetramitiformis]|uniref:Uncharacterized protein n=1 Tax=Cymbomonas tetramitiformis TaxID=36881 RepID=A0AAE0CD92_9CHLO|nr:hypothetical protein CYMTET_38471 [Cymbomonas tetramitiformis]